MPSIRVGLLGWNIDKKSTPTERSDWSILLVYVINICISPISICHLRQGLSRCVRSPITSITDFYHWRASEASETLSGQNNEKKRYMLLASERSERDTIRVVQIRAGAVYIYVWRYVCHNSSECHAYVMWAELIHCHFLYVPAILNVIIGTSTKNILKLNRALGFEFSIQSSVYGASTVL